MEDYEVRLAMNRTRQPVYDIDLRPKHADKKIEFSANIQNMSAIVGHDLSVILLIPKNIATYKNPMSGKEDIDGTDYVRALADVRLVPYIEPYGIFGCGFGNSVELQHIPPALISVIVRVYDRIGQASETEFIISLFSSPKGLVTERKNRQIRSDALT
jgi:hypothetical protein